MAGMIVSHSIVNSEPGIAIGRRLPLLSLACNSILRQDKDWIPFLHTTMLTIYGFYFGSRGFEKIQKIRASRTDSSKLRNMVPSFDQEPKEEHLVDEGDFPASLPRSSLLMHNKACMICDIQCV